MAREREPGRSLPAPIPAGATDAELNGISCPTLTACFAIGRSDTAAGNVTLIEQWDGDDLDDGREPERREHDQQRAQRGHVPDRRDCFAVGDNRVVGNRRSLILQDA